MPIPEQKKNLSKATRKERTGFLQLLVMMSTNTSTAILEAKQGWNNICKVQQKKIASPSSSPVGKKSFKNKDKIKTLLGKQHEQFYI